MERTRCQAGDSRSGSAGSAAPDLVAVGRQMIQQHLAAVRAPPAIEVPLLPRLTPQTAPDHAVPDAELGGERWPDGGMPEGVG